MCTVGVLLLACCLSLLAPAAEAMAKNEGTESNNLGLLAQACASSYCGVGVTPLDLWLSLEEVSEGVKSLCTPAVSRLSPPVSLCCISSAVPFTPRT